ncbi:hypothetical protein FIU88_08035 [Halomonas sp. THAF12]|uniref:hypothetical protein n=1 Tax=Halomonas sp. THAF12 TaxID=2587849 RepID=UPI00126901F5|nr:hypothetical protein [Halomonas sp. THAF12]QFT84922.1 hypothetical protein FIU88_08035 [Halomonas sp. THAF12]
MSIDIDKLEALAQAATPGPWSMAEDGSPVVNAGGRAAHLIGPPGSDEEAAANTQFIAATDPDAILALIARLREAEAAAAERDALAAHVEQITRAPATHEILEEIHRRAGKEWSGDFIVTINRDEYEAFEAEQEALLSTTPATSLARRDVVKGAGLLTLLIDKAEGRGDNHWTLKELKMVRDELRRQAEQADTAKEDA